MASESQMWAALLEFLQASDSLDEQVRSSERGGEDDQPMLAAKPKAEVAPVF